MSVLYASLNREIPVNGLDPHELEELLREAVRDHAVLYTLFPVLPDPVTYNLTNPRLNADGTTYMVTPLDKGVVGI